MPAVLLTVLVSGVIITALWVISREILRRNRLYARSAAVRAVDRTIAAYRAHPASTIVSSSEKGMEDVDSLELIDKLTDEADRIRNEYFWYEWDR